MARKRSPVLQIDGLSRWFGEQEAVAPFDAALEPGERLALTGPNGSGKTTILRCVCGTLAPSGGSVRVGGYAAGSLEARRKIGASLSQERSFYLRLSGYQNLLFFARLVHQRERESKQAVRGIIDELELAEIAAERVSRCSTGMAQQLSFARALLGDPALLVLDEPTRSLDPGAIARLWAAIERRPQASVLIATHRADDVARCNQRIDLGS
jgi:ABC-2 type transport system ATP-binding protein